MHKSPRLVLQVDLSNFRSAVEQLGKNGKKKKKNTHKKHIFNSRVSPVYNLELDLERAWDTIDY